jgi:hypothetical protein
MAPDTRWTRSRSRTPSSTSRGVKQLALVLVAFGVAFGFDWPFWAGALAGGWIGLAQWRNERSTHAARGTD